MNFSLRSFVITNIRFHYALAYAFESPLVQPE